MHKKKNMPNRNLLIVFVVVLLGGIFYWYLYANKKFEFQKPVPAKRIETINVGLINDLHAVAVQKGNEPLRLVFDYQRSLQSFFQKLNAFSPEIVVANGDMIDGTRQTSEIAMKELEFLNDSFEKNISIPKYWTIGNHELRAVNRAQWKSSLKIDYQDLAIERGGYKIIFLDSGFGTGGDGNDTDAAGSELLLSEKQLSWLEKELSNSDKIKLIFMHFPPIYGPDVKLGYLPVGVENLQKLFSKYKVAAVFSGHVENALHKKIEGVDYYILPGNTKNKIYEGAFSRIRMIDNRAIVTLFYKGADLEYVSKKIE